MAWAETAIGELFYVDGSDGASVSAYGNKLIANMNAMRLGPVLRQIRVTTGKRSSFSSPFPVVITLLSTLGVAYPDGPVV